MDPKQLSLPGQLFSSRRKVVSGFGLCVGVTVFILSVFLLCSPLHERFVSPLFRGFYNVTTVGSSSLVSWPFSFSRPFSSNASDEVNSSVDSVPKLAEVEESRSGDPQLGHFTDKAINESFRVESPTNKILSNSSENGSVLGRIHLGTASQVLSKGSLPDGGGKVCQNLSIHGNEDTKAKTVRVKSTENTSVLVSNVTEIANVGNVSLSGEIAGSNPEGDRVHRDEGVVSLNECDIFDGGWVRDDSKPFYPAGSCPYIDRDFDCHRNGRPDDEFVKWKWQPNGCDIPSLNATDFLERMRGKKLVFVGDSLNRNMWESLVCILRHSIRKKNRVYEISGRREFKKKGFYAFRFEDYDCTVDFVGSPFLVRESSYKGGNATFETLRLDLMDKTTSMYQDADIIVFNTGHWWTHEKTSRGENYYQEGNHVYPRLKVMEAYKRALLTWAKWIDKNIDSNRTQVFFRGYSVTHFRGGRWNSGGQCHRETEPISNATFLAKYPSKMKVLQHVLEDMKTSVVYLNISRLTDYRKDGHPSIYRMKYKTEEERAAAQQSQDCSHWCLPGVPDTWNELLYASLLKAGRGSWRI